jgi:hypothetical protein
MGPPTCPTGLVKPLASTGRLTVPGRGEITFELSDGAECVGYEAVWDEAQELAFTGGTGSFVGASGSGKVERFDDDDHPRGLLEIWTGTLTAAGLPLDFTAPRLTGAAGKTTRAAKGARRARVTFKVTATDDVDGVIPVSCHPRSGSRFRVGRTVVLCAATDSSGNTATARFTVTVRRAAR